MIIPTVVEQTPNGEKYWDIISRVLKDRIIFVNGEINNDMSQIIISQLLYLESEDKDKDITMYINSPGGAVTDTFAILDVMNTIKPDVSTVCIGEACSGGSVLLAGGAKGKRFILPNAEVMIHQPLGGAQGQATDIEIRANHINRTKKKLVELYSKWTGKNAKTIAQTIERDAWFTAEEAVKFGLVDKIVEKK